jgi:hypothetical protein
MERGNKVIDERVSEWLEALKDATGQIDEFVAYVAEQGATKLFASGGIFARFDNGWSVAARLICPDGLPPFVRYKSWHVDWTVDTMKEVKNDWRAAVDRAVSGGVA